MKKKQFIKLLVGSFSLISLPFLSTQCSFFEMNKTQEKNKDEIQNDLNNAVEKIKIWWDKDNLEASKKAQIDVKNLNDEEIKNELKFYNCATYLVEVKSIKKDDQEGTITVNFVLKDEKNNLKSKSFKITFTGFKANKINKQEIVDKLNKSVKNVKVEVEKIAEKLTSEILLKDLFYSGFDKNTEEVIFKNWAKTNNEIKVTFTLKNKNYNLESNEFTYILTGFKVSKNISGETVEELNEIAKKIVFDVNNKQNIFSNSVIDYTQLKVANIDSTKYNITYNKLECLPTSVKVHFQINNKDNTFSDIQVFEITGFKVAKSKIRIGMWNILNLYETSEEYKKYGLASVIEHLNLDVIGLIENKTKASAQKFCEYLKKFTGNNNWELIASDNTIHNPKLAPTSKQHECPAFIYKKDKIAIEKFINGKEWLGYDNSTFVVNEENNNLGYVRPPMGVKFKTLGPIQNNFTFVIDHLDSPGAAKSGESKSSLLSKQGAQEADEAYNLKNLMDWFDQQDGDNDDLIFMGDTNIKLGNQATAFSEILKDQYYKALLTDSKQHKSSLSNSTWGKYSEPYDKIFTRTNLKYENANLFPLYDIFKDNILKDYQTIEEWKTYVDTIRKKTYDKDLKYIFHAISDHSPIYFDLILDPNDIL